MAETAKKKKSQLLWTNIVLLLQDNIANLKADKTMLVKQHSYLKRFSAKSFISKAVMFLNCLFYRYVSAQQRSIDSHSLQYFMRKSGTANE
jgi:hypothetical protein